MSKKFCFWTVADNNHGKMAATMVASARAVGVTADFHIWTDMPYIKGATVHSCGTFDKSLYMFKFHFLKNEVSKLNYDYFVFLDADNYFMRDPGDLSTLMGPTDKVFVQMENDCSPNKSKRSDWWTCPIHEYGKFLHEQGAVSDIYYNTNAGFWIVAKRAINEFYDRTTKFFDAAHARGYTGFTEEPALAFVGHIMQDPKKRLFKDTCWLWASDWKGHWANKIPKDTEWEFEDYINGDITTVKPCIVHCMRSKNVMVSEYYKEIANRNICGDAQFDILMCCYGDYPDISIKSINAIIATKSKNIKIHVALNSCCRKTKLHYRNLLDNNHIETLMEFNTNINKDAAMRKLIDACTSEYFLWLDDDTYPINSDWINIIEKSFAVNKYDIGGFTHVCSRSGFENYNKFLEQRPWFKSWRKYDEFKDSNLKNGVVSFPVGFVWVGKVDYLVRNNYPDHGMVKKCDDMLLGEMIYQTNAKYVHLGESLWNSFNRNTAERRGSGEDVAGWKFHQNEGTE